MLDQRRDDLLGRADIGQRIGDDEGLEPGQRLKWHLRDLPLVEFLDVHAAHMSERHGGSAKLGGIRDCKIDLVLGRDAAFKGHPIRLGDDISMAVLGEVEALLLGERRLEIARLADQA